MRENGQMATVCSTWFVLAALLLAAACMAFMLVGCSGGTAPASSSSAPVSESAASVADAQPELGERMEFGGISYAIPAGWVSQKADNGGMYYYPSANDRSSLIHVLASELAVPSGKEQEAFAGILNGIIGGEDKRPSDLQTRDFKVDGHPAQHATYTSEVNGSPYSIHFVSILLDGTVAMFMGGTPLPDAPYDDAFEACIDSIQIAPASNGSKAAKEKPAASSSSSQGAKKSASDGRIDADKFAAIKQGMSYEEVVGIIGSEGELVSSSTIAGIENTSYTWEADGWGIATIMFQDGAVINKSQVGVAGSDDVKVTMDAFNKIENGMSYEQVVEIMGGEGELLSETELAGMSMSIYTWDGNTAFSSCQITFQDGVVSSKSQYGLK